MGKKDKKGKKKAVDDWEEDLPTADSKEPEIISKPPVADPESDLPQVVEDDEYGGLMAQISKAAKSEKKKKKKNATKDADLSVTVDEDLSNEPSEPVVVTEVRTMQPEDWADEEFGSTGKKEKKKKKGGDVSDEKVLNTDAEKAGEDGGEIKLLSKKEKEKLKKQREKEKKKAEAEKKKASQPVAQKVTEGENEKEVEKKVDLPPPTPVERRRIEEEERRKQEAKRIKKEKEKAKKEQLKREGKLLTKAQKARQQQAQLRLQQMIEAGHKVEGLDKEGDQKPKRVVYSNKKRKPGKNQDKDETKASPSGTEVSSHIAEDSQENLEKALETSEEANVKNIKESWDEEDEEENVVTVENDKGVKDSWDLSSDEEEEIQLPKEDVSAKKQVKSETQASTKDSVKPPVQAPPPKTQPKPSAKEESEESEEESEESESDSSEEETESEGEITEHQKQIMKRKAEAAERRKLRHEQALAARSKDDLRSPICCKCFGKGTPIMMYDGRIQSVETIKENDQVMGDDSTPRKVSGVTHGEGLLYKIIPMYDSFALPFVCNDAHILVLKMISGPSVHHQCCEDGSSRFRLLYFVFNRTTNLIEKMDKLYSYPSIDYPTVFYAENTAFRDLKLLDQLENTPLGKPKSVYSIVRPGFIWQPSVTQFLSCDPEVKAEARMYSPDEVRFPKREGAFSRTVDQVMGSSTPVSVVKLCAWLIGSWIGDGFESVEVLSEYNKGVLECNDGKTSDHEIRSNRNVLTELLKGLDILVDKDIPDAMMYDDINAVRLPLLSGLISSRGFQNETLKNNEMIKKKFLHLSRSCGYGDFIIDANRKFDKFSRTQRQDQLWRFEVEELGVGEYYGFVVDRNHRFLLGDFTVTHNTKLLDKIRQTNVQEGEAGGITQQIGATYFPMENIKIKTAPLNKDGKQEYKLPGLLVIDTPGHESFTNLRSRGSSLCNIAILVVDIMHGLEPQTLESLRLLRDRKTPFIVALNKIDRLFDWKPVADNSFQDSLSKQSKSVQREFENRVEKTILAFSEQGLNSCLYYENKNFAKYVSLVPTSAITGEGIPDMLMLLVNLTQSRMSNELMYLSELECTVLEVKVIEGHGTTIDVILSNGVLNEGDRIVLCGLNGPIVTTIRALLTPQPLRELRVKSAYVHNKSVKAALGVKISAQDLDKAIAGSRLMVIGPDDDEDDLKDEVMSDLKSLMSSIDKSGKGVCVQASTLGSLEALLEFLKVSKIPVSGINIGPVHKKDIMRSATMLERARELAVILCFDVKVDKEAQDLADELSIKIFKADIIYHLFDQFMEYNKDIMEQKRKDQAPQAVFPCILKIIPGAIFNKKDPIIIGVDVIDGVLRTGTPICVVKVDPETKEREIISLGKVTSIEQNHKSVDVVKKGQAGGGVAVRLECPVYESQKTFGRHFTESDELYNVLKESFRDDLSKEDWQLIIKLKKILDIN
ncbi:11613_t:CDS:10 [Acaulospora colombiana]|uniref:11613_t:CDS:1 n=1 Tax=Acaulospora colombiana TaxID=27376 RepID=A0ACA9KNN8_9GLOM|nr:11613_t:CDS:10 [Acaulospora colombiana]